MSLFKSWSFFLLIISVFQIQVSQADDDTETTTPVEQDDTTKQVKERTASAESTTASEQSIMPMDASRKKATTTKGNQYLNPYDIYNQVNKFVEKQQNLYENVNITVEKLGKTAEYKDIVIIKLNDVANQSSNNSSLLPQTSLRTATESVYEVESEKKIVLIVHGLSAMGFEGVPCLAREKELAMLASYYFENSKDFNIYLVPLANPDGILKQQTNRFWNKNVSPQSGCKGVAVDRNFDVERNESASDACSQQYGGPYAFSEKESIAIRDLFHKYGHRIHGYIHVHAGTATFQTMKGDAILYPKGYSEVSTDDDKYVDLKGEIYEMLNLKNFKVLSVTVDTLYSWYGKVSGSSVDYISTIYGVPFALEFVMQLYEPDNPVQEYVLPNVYKGIIETIFKVMKKHLKENE